MSVADELANWVLRINNLCNEKDAEIEKLQAQIARDEEHYQAAMKMFEKQRKLWVEACQENTHLRAALSSRLRLLRQGDQHALD
jgi:acetyl-CoA carboxylase carboxyltransferase component